MDRFLVMLNYRCGVLTIPMSRAFDRAVDVRWIILLAICLCPLRARAASDVATAGLFRDRCSGCHAIDGSGDTPAGRTAKIHDLRSDDIQKQSDAELVDFISNGKRSSRGLAYSMPANKGILTSDQIRQLVMFIREFKKR